MAPSADEIGKGIKDAQFLDYFDESQGNILMIADTDVSVVCRKLANNFGMDFHEQGVRLFTYVDGEDEDDPVISSANTTSHSIIAYKKR
jgi:hypothetical protein